MYIGAAVLYVVGVDIGNGKA